jgi:predicted metalloprotease
MVRIDRDGEGENAMRWDDMPESGNIEDRRDEGDGGGGGYGGGGGGFGIPGGAGGLSIGTVLILGIVGYALGIDPSLLIGGAEVLTGNQPGVQTQAPSQQRRTGTPSDQSGRFVSRVLGSTEVVWKEILAQNGKAYRPPTLVLFNRVTEARACGGLAQAAMGPFYCPGDRKVYLDTSFFREIESRFQGCSGKACEFSQAYVIAHEVGHHVQNELNILSRATSAQRSAGGRAQANHIQVQVELQADCLAGVWANRSDQQWHFLQPGDIEAALRTAAAIGDDTLQKRSQGRVVPDSFTHGTSEQRQRWFNNGFKGGKVASCDTFGAQQL